MKLLATAVGSALLGGGLVFGATTDSAEVIDLKAEKHQILQDNIWKDVRLGEIPAWDISVVSSKEMGDAYVATVNEKQADTKEPNLYTALREKAVSLGVQCITK